VYRSSNPGSIPGQTYDECENGCSFLLPCDFSREDVGDTEIVSGHFIAFSDPGLVIAFELSCIIEYTLSF
jgi:hypothetical protein